MRLPVYSLWQSSRAKTPASVSRRILKIGVQEKYFFKGSSPVTYEYITIHGQQVSRSAGQQVSRSAGQQVSRSAGQQVSRSIIDKLLSIAKLAHLNL